MASRISTTGGDNVFAGVSMLDVARHNPRQSADSSRCIRTTPKTMSRLAAAVRGAVVTVSSLNADGTTNRTTTPGQPRLDIKTQHSFRPGDMVKGSVIVPDGFDESQHKLMVALIGKVQYNTVRWAEEKSRYTEKTATWDFIRQVTEVGVPLRGSSSQLRKADFAIWLPASLQPRQCPLHEHQHLALPSSLGKRRPDGLCDLTAQHTDLNINYLVRTDIVDRLDNRVLEGDRKEIIVQAVALPAPLRVDEIEQKQPPLPGSSISGPSNNWCTPASGISISTRLGSEQGKLALALEPEKCFDTTTGVYDGYLAVTFTAASPSIMPPQLKKVNASLVATTIGRTEHFHLHRRPSVRSTYHMVAPLEPSSQFARALSVSPQTAAAWQSGTSWTRSSDNELQWHARVPLRVQLEGVGTKFYLPPCFESCLASRRYRLRLEIGLSSDKALKKFGKIEYHIGCLVADQKPASTFVIDEARDLAVGDADKPTYEEVTSAHTPVAPCAEVPGYDFADAATLAALLSASGRDPASLHAAERGSLAEQQLLLDRQAAAERAAERERIPAWAAKAECQ
ncbi:hypothetical protein PYCC9005_002272 [Savitreella phatthalungensis]